MISEDNIYNLTSIGRSEDFINIISSKIVELKEDIEQNYSETFGYDDETKELVSALQKLPQKYSSVITLYYYEGYRIAEISKILDCSENTVKSRLKRARKNLADVMHNEEE